MTARKKITVVTPAYNEDECVDELATRLAAVFDAMPQYDFEAIVIDGAFPQSVRSVLVEQTREKFQKMEMQGVAPVEIVEGRIGSEASVLGAASLPLLAGFSRDRDLLFRVGT